MSGIFPTPARLRRIIITIESLLDLFDGTNQAPPSLVVFTIAEPQLSALPNEFKSRLSEGNKLVWITENEDAWARRMEGLQVLELELNPNNHPFSSPLRLGRLVNHSVGWNDALGCPHAFRDLFDVHNALIRAHGLERMSETGYIRWPSYPILEHMGFQRTVVRIDPETGDETDDTEANPLPPFDATSLPPSIEFWMRDQLRAVLGRLRQVEERGHNTEEAADTPPDLFAPLRAMIPALRLKGIQAAVVLAICDGGGRVPIKDLAFEHEWTNPTDNWNSVRKQLNEKFKGRGWHFSTHDNNAVAEQVPVPGQK